MPKWTVLEAIVISYLGSYNQFTAVKYASPPFNVPQFYMLIDPLFAIGQNVLTGFNYRLHLTQATTYEHLFFSLNRKVHLIYFQVSRPFLNTLHFPCFR